MSFAEVHEADSSLVETYARSSAARSLCCSPLRVSPAPADDGRQYGVASRARRTRWRGFSRCKLEILSGIFYLTRPQLRVSTDVGDSGASAYPQNLIACPIGQMGARRELSARIFNECGRETRRG